MPLNENVKINLSVDELLSIYHYVPKILLKLAKKVSVTEESFAYSNQSSIVFTEARNGNYLVIATEDVNKSWLLPRAKLRINEFEYQTVQSLFECRGYQLGAVNKFIAKKPAIVSLALNDKDWKLEQRGILEFGLASASSQESMELEQVEEENQELRSELSELDSQLTKIKEEYEQILSRFNQSEEERKQLLSSLGILAKTHKESFSQLANWDNLFKQMLMILQQGHFISLKQELELKEKPPITVTEAKVDSQNKNEGVEKSLDDLLNEIENIKQNNPTPEEFDKSTETSPSINLQQPENPIIKFIEDYNSNPNSIAKNSIEVKEGEDTNYLLRLGFPIVMIKSNINEGICWVLNINNSYYLVPKHNLKLHINNDLVLDSLFILQNYQPKYSQKFQLIKPAALVSIEKEKSWQLKEKGELQFMPSR